MEEKKVRQETVCDVIEFVAEEVCDKYCKYREKVENAEMSVSELDAICGDCPLSRLY